METTNSINSKKVLGVGRGARWWKTQGKSRSTYWTETQNTKEAPWRAWYLRDESASGKDGDLRRGLKANLLGCTAPVYCGFCKTSRKEESGRKARNAQLDSVGPEQHLNLISNGANILLRIEKPPTDTPRRPD